MFQLLDIALALAALTAAELGLESGIEAPWAVLALVCVPYLARALVAGSRRPLAFGRLFALMSPALYFAAVCGLGWRDSVARWTGGEPTVIDWPGPSLLLALAPFALYFVAGVDAKVRLGGLPRSLWSQLRSLELRMFAVSLLPFLLYFLIAGLIGLFPALGVRVEEVSLFNVAFIGLFVAVFITLLPRWIRFAWRTEPLAQGMERRIFDELAQATGFRCREVLVWRTSNLVANAAVIGIGARSRIVLLTDSLLRILPPRELRAVCAHEIGHARRHHVLIFMVASLGWLGLVDVASRDLDPTGEWLGVGVLALGLLGWYFGFGWMSRRFEQDADLFALQHTADPGALESALARLDGGLHGKSGWRHFSPRLRAEFLARAATDDGYATRFRARLRLVSLAGLLTFIAAVSLEGNALIKAFPEERAIADQRLGDAASARTRVARMAEQGRELRRLIGRAAGEARFALEEGRVEDALSWLELGALAGDERMGRVARGVRAGDEAAWSGWLGSGDQ